MARKTTEQIREEQIQSGAAMAAQDVVAPPPADYVDAGESDEIPMPPPVGGSMPGRDGTPEAGTQAGAGDIPADFWNAIPTERPTMPAQTFHFRCESFAGLKKGPKAWFYETKWVCQIEPWTGYPVYCNIMWATPELIQAAMSGDPEAIKYCKTNMREGKVIMTRAKWHNTNLGEFLGSHPEMNIRLKIKEKMTKVGYDAEGKAKYEPSKEFGNEVGEFLPLK